MPWPTTPCIENDGGSHPIGGKPARVGIAQHIALFDPHAWWSPIDHATAYFNDKVFNRAFLKAATSGALEFTIPGAKGVKETYTWARNSLDFIGVNYYTRWRCRGSRDRISTRGAPKNALGWEIYPPGLFRGLKLAGHYSSLLDSRKIPLNVTENGLDDRDGSVRNDFLVRHLRFVAKAIERGIPVQGYMHWTLLDNFEWAEGYEPRFGLYFVNRQPGADLARVPTPTVQLFRQITAVNGLPADLD